MRRVPAILVLLAVAAAGSGALRYAHEREHRHGPGAPAHAHSHDVGHGRHANHGDAPAPEPLPHHDESDCLIHALLKAPMFGAGQAAALPLVGTFAAFVSPPPAPVRCRRPMLALDSRGPPVSA